MDGESSSIIWLLFLDFGVLLGEALTEEIIDEFGDDMTGVMDCSGTLSTITAGEETSDGSREFTSVTNSSVDITFLTKETPHR